MATIDDIINGSFDALGAKPAYMSPAYDPADYSSIYASSGGTTPKTNRYYPPVPTYQAGMLGRGQPSRLSTASALAATDRLAAGSPGLPINPTGQYNAVNPFVLAALTAQQGAKNPVEITVTGGRPASYPAWVSRAKGDFFSGQVPASSAMLPVNTMTPELEAAYADSSPAGRKKLANLLADAAQAGNIGKAPVAKGGLASLINGNTAPRSSGGLFGMLFGGGGGASATPMRASTATGTGSNGYVYSNGQRTGVAPQYAGMSPSQMYDAINAAAGNRTSSGNRSSFDDNQEMGRANYSLASSNR